MSTTITGKLNQSANKFQAGESTGFGIRIGVKYRDPKTKEDLWTNYSAVIFAKSSGQIQFYNDVLIEGSIVEVSAQELAVSSFEGSNGVSLSINMLNARLGYVYSPQQAQQQPQVNNQQQNNYQQQQAPQQQVYQQQVYQQPNFNQQGG